MADHQARCRSACCAASEPVLDVVDPPEVVVIPGGGDDMRSPVESAVGGGTSGFNLPTLWELITDTAEEVPIRSAMTQLLDQLEETWQ